MNSFLKDLEETKINSTIKGIPFLKSKKVKKLKFEKLNIIKENVQFPILSIDKENLLKRSCAKFPKIDVNIHTIDELDVISNGNSII